VRSTGGPVGLGDDERHLEPCFDERPRDGAAESTRPAERDRHMQVHELDFAVAAAALRGVVDDLLERGARLRRGCRHRGASPPL